MNLRGTIVNAKASDIAPYAFDDRFACHTVPAKDLQAAVDDAHDRF